LWCQSSFVPFDECDEGVEGAGDIPGTGVSFAASFVDDDSGGSSGVDGLFFDVVDPTGEVEARVVFDLDGRPVFVGNPNVSTVKGCSGRYSFSFDASDVEMVGDGTFSGRSFGFVLVGHVGPPVTYQTQPATMAIRMTTPIRGNQSVFIVEF
jgi:hypothetical protein